MLDIDAGQDFIAVVSVGSFPGEAAQGASEYSNDGQEDTLNATAHAVQHHCSEGYWWAGG